MCKTLSPQHPSMDGWHSCWSCQDIKDCQNSTKLFVEAWVGGEGETLAHGKLIILPGLLRLG